MVLCCYQKKQKDCLVFCYMNTKKKMNKKSL